jgi:hypothetical protein
MLVTALNDKLTEPHHCPSRTIVMAESCLCLPDCDIAFFRNRPCLVTSHM